jgi:hypothetical protein
MLSDFIVFTCRSSVWNLLSLSLSSIFPFLPFPVAALRKMCVVLDRSNIGIVGSNPAGGVNVECVCACASFSVLCCPLYVEAYRWADPPSKSPNKMSERIHTFQSLFFSGTGQRA